MVGRRTMGEKGSWWMVGAVSRESRWSRASSACTALVIGGYRPLIPAPRELTGKAGLGDRFVTGWLGRFELGDYRLSRCGCA